AVAVVAGATALGGEVVLVPPLELGLWRQRKRASRLAADQIAADRDEPSAALRPDRRQDGSGTGAPVEAGYDRPLDGERIEQRDRVDGQRRLLPVADSVLREEPCAPVAA